jgi:hypothetical protein
MKKISLIAISLFTLSILTGCATPPPPKNYTNFRESNPKSVLILPPINDTTNVDATYSLYSSTQSPMSESGFYTLPIAVVDEVFKKNGVFTPHDMHAIDIKKLHEIFGADAAMYITITQSGSKYYLVGSSTIVTAKAKMLDLKNGNLLWEGVASASSDENSNHGGGLAAILIGAIINQVMASVTNKSHQISQITNQRLLSAHSNGGLLYGPRHSLYGKDK